jgi:hypothetical protein
MIDKKIEQLKMLKKISLSQEEKGVLRAGVARGIQIARETPIASIFHRSIQHGLRIGLSTFLFIVFVGGSVSVIADNSLPGDPLYSFKLNVNEEVKGAFLKTPEAKLTYQKTLIDNRLNEIKTLAASKTLTKAKQETAQKALNTHIEAFSKELVTLSDEKPNKALEVTASLEKSLKVQKEDIKQYISENTEEDQTNALKAVDATIQKVSDQEVKIISKEIDQISDDINKVPETTASKDLEKTTIPPVLPSGAQKK